MSLFQGNRRSKIHIFRMQDKGVAIRELKVSAVETLELPGGTGAQHLLTPQQTALFYVGQSAALYEIAVDRHNSYTATGMAVASSPSVPITQARVFSAIQRLTSVRTGTP